MNFTHHEARVIGCLLEKEITTPEQYPLSLNSLTLACNQKSSREPVLSMSEADTQVAIDALTKRRLVTDQSGFGSRVVKYKHRFCNTEFSDFQFSPAQVAIICLLLLRGPQTPGELRTRSNRLHAFGDVSEVDKALNQLAERQQPLVKQLAREPGKRESRFTELLSEHNEQLACAVAPPEHTPTQHAAMSTVQTTLMPSASPSQDELIARITALEKDVAMLKTALADLLD